MVHFGKTLERERISRYGHEYIEYRVLKKQLKQIFLRRRPGQPIPQNDESEIQFMRMFESELHKVNAFVKNKMKEFANSVSNLQRRVHLSKETPDSLEAETDSLGQEFVLLQKFIFQNEMGFSKIAKKHDKKTGLNSRPWLEARLSYGDCFKHANFDVLVVGLSDVYSRIRKLRETLRKQKEGLTEGEDKVWVPPQSFERKTTKYWVDLENLLATKILIVKHLPVLIFGRKEEGRPPSLEISASQFTVADSSPITSIYLDSSALDMYHKRIIREEGAQLIRLRWYGHYSESKKPAEVFVERKTHHECWVENESVKERFPIKWKHVLPYLQGTWSPTESFKNKVIKGEMKQQEAEKTIQLSDEVQAKINEVKLKPMVRTVYSRSAFQLASTNAVRISIDTNLVMMNEATPKPSGKWILEDKDIPPNEKVNFNYAILEIKLQDTPPDWINDLMEMGFLTEVTKFSKFLNGCCQLHPEKVKIVPHWHTPESITELQRQKFKLQQEEEIARKKREDDNDLKIEAKSKKSEMVPLMEGYDYEGPSKSRMRARAKASKDNCFSGISNLLTRSKPLENEDKKQHTPVRVEPKTFFANERTFIQWLSASLFLTTLCIALISLGTTTAKYAGLVIFPLVFFFIFYSLYQYVTRLKAIKSREKMRFDDVYGPPLLVLCVLIAMIIIVGLYWSDIIGGSTDSPGTIKNPDSLSKWVDVSQDCQKLDTSQLLRFFGPSGLALNEDTNTLWLSSKYQIASINLDDTNLTNTYPVPNYDINGIAVVPGIDDRIFLAVEWTDNNGIAEYSLYSESVKRVWILTDILGEDPIVGGLSYISSEASYPYGLFYIPTTDGLIGVEIPVFDNTTSSKNYRVVDSLPLTRYMVGNDTRIQGVDFLTVNNEPYVYTIFSQIQEIRSWNFNSGAETGRFDLPGHTTSWGGIAFPSLSSSPYLYACLTSPAEVWKFKWNPSSGFPSCAK